jgi:hypothetical protein
MKNQLPLARRDRHRGAAAVAPPWAPLLDIGQGQEWIKPFSCLENTAVFVR